MATTVYRTPKARKEAARLAALEPTASVPPAPFGLSIVPVPSVVRPPVSSSSSRPMEVTNDLEEPKPLTPKQIERQKRRAKKREERAAHVARTLRREIIRSDKECTSLGAELDYFRDFQNVIPVERLLTEGTYLGLVALSKGTYEDALRSNSYAAYEMILSHPNGLMDRYYIVVHDNGKDAPYYVHIAELASPTDLRYMEGRKSGSVACRNRPTAARYDRRRYRSDREEATKENSEFRRNVKRHVVEYGVDNQDDEFLRTHAEHFEYRRERGYLTYTFLSSKNRSSYSTFFKIQSVDKVEWDLHIVNSVSVRNYKEEKVMRDIYYGRPIVRETYLNGVQASIINYSRRGYSSFVSFSEGVKATNFFGRSYGVRTINMSDSTKNPIPPLYLYRYRDSEKKRSRRAHKKVYKKVLTGKLILPAGDAVASHNIMKDLYYELMAKSSRDPIFRTRAIIGGAESPGVGRFEATLFGQQREVAYFKKVDGDNVEARRFDVLSFRKTADQKIWYRPPAGDRSQPARRRVHLFGDKAVEGKPVVISYSDERNRSRRYDASRNIRERTYQGGIVTISDNHKTYSYDTDPRQKVSVVRRLFEKDFPGTYKEFCRKEVHSIFTMEMSEAIRVRYGIPLNWVYRHNYNALRHYDPSMYYALEDECDLMSIVTTPEIFRSRNTPLISRIRRQKLPDLSNGARPGDYPIGALVPRHDRYYLVTDPEVAGRHDDRITRSVTIQEIRSLFI